MDNKNETKKHRCPTCGRYLSNDVFKMREEIEQKDRLIALMKRNAEIDCSELAKKNSVLKSLNQSNEALKAHIKQKDAEIAKLWVENDKLRNRGFFERLFNLRTK